MVFIIVTTENLETKKPNYPKKNQINIHPQKVLERMSSSHNEYGFKNQPTEEGSSCDTGPYDHENGVSE